MKHKTLTFLLTACLLALGNFAFAEISADELQRSLTHATQLAQAEVTVSFLWEKKVRARDVMSRPARMGAGNAVIRVDRETTSCKGILTNQNNVITPAVCAENGNFELKQISLQLKNGKTATGASSVMSIKEDIAYIRVTKQATQGLVGLALAPVQAGQSVEDVVGAHTLASFFAQKGVPAKSRRIGMGRRDASPNLKIGDALVVNGRVVALVKAIPRHYKNPFGVIMESALAIIR